MWKGLEPVPKPWRSRSANLPPHDFDNFFRIKMLHEVRSFLTYWRSLSAKPSELLMSNWWCMVPLVKQFNRANQLLDIRCCYIDNMSRTWYLRKIGDFEEKANLLEWKTSAVQLRSSRSAALRTVKRWWDSVKRAQVGSSITEIPISKHCLLHDFDKYFQKKMLLEFSTFFAHWRSLARRSSELLASNWRGLVPLVKQFNRSEEVFDISRRYGDITSHTPAEDRRFRWKGDFVGIKDVGCFSYSLRVLQTYGP